jgi:hypothetical protein
LVALVAPLTELMRIQIMETSFCLSIDTYQLQQYLQILKKLSTEIFKQICSAELILNNFLCGLVDRNSDH